RERPDEDVDLAVVRRVEEEQPLLPLKGVEGNLRLVALVAEELLHALGAALGRDEVEVGVAAREDLRQLARSAEPDRDAAEEAERHPSRARQLEQALALGDDVRLDP